MKKNKVVLSALFLICSVCVFIVLPACNTGKSGDGQKVVDIESLPQVSAAKIFVADGSNEKIQLTRSGKLFSLLTKAGLVFFSGDEISNISDKIVSISGVVHDCRFSLKPSVKASFEENSVTVIQGGMQMCFNKVNGVFKLSVPTATIGIRGTRLDVHVSHDKKSILTLHEGKITVDQNGKETAVNPGETVQIDPDKKTLTVEKTTDDLLKAFDRISSDSIQKILR
ncbi:MAG: FecR domain-containing protein [Candidatus Riflebacteria bacterium]|nr:FecR domain-containing protein [Candidatus Riflebacteria bacterium]